MGGDACSERGRWYSFRRWCAILWLIWPTLKYFKIKSAYRGTSIFLCFLWTIRLPTTRRTSPVLSESIASARRQKINWTWFLDSGTVLRWYRLFYVIYATIKDLWINFEFMFVLMGVCFWMRLRRYLTRATQFLYWSRCAWAWIPSRRFTWSRWSIFFKFNSRWGWWAARIIWLSIS